MSACTWWSTKWPDAAPDHQVVRCFVANPSDDDARLVDGCVSDLHAMIGSGVDPHDHVVTRWEEGLPEYRVGHFDRVAAIDTALAPHPGLALAGAGYRGAGLPDCVAQADDAVARVLSRLRSASR